jgi:sulfur-oxidizing protein SoxY
METEEAMSGKQAKSAISRREVLAFAGVAALAIGVAPRLAHATAEQANKAIMKLVGDKKPQEGRVTLKLPEIAENGNTVPVTVSVDSPMTENDYVKAVHVFAEGNPNPEVASFHFTPRSGVATASTRMRLAKTQDIVAVAEMSDGSVYVGRQAVKVTIGGCGG